MTVVNLLDGGAETRGGELPCGADSGAASAGHTFARVRLDFRQRLELLPVKQVKIDSGTWDQTETEIYHLSRTKVL